MLLETNRLVILTVAEQEFDEDVRTIVCINGIFLKPDGITVEQLERNPSLLSGKIPGLPRFGNGTNKSGCLLCPSSAIPAHG